MPVLYPEMTPLIALDIDEVRRNVESANARGLPEAVTAAESRSDQIVAIIGGGPSMREKIPGEERTFLQRLNADQTAIRVVTGSAHNLLNNTLLGYAHASVFNLPDPVTINEKTGARESYADNINPPREDIIYYAASQCDPRVFDKLAESGVPVEIFHSCVEGSGHAPDKMRIGAGSTAPTAALALMMAKGCRKFEFYGVDGGRKMKPEDALAAIERHESPGKDSYAYELPDNLIAKDTVIVQIGDDYYSTTVNFWEQIQEMEKFIDLHGAEATFHFHGVGRLSGALLNQPRPQSYRVYDLSKPPAPAPEYPAPGV